MGAWFSAFYSQLCDSRGHGAEVEIEVSPSFTCICCDDAADKALGQDLDSTHK